LSVAGVAQPEICDWPGLVLLHDLKASVQKKDTHASKQNNVIREQYAFARRVVPKTKIEYVTAERELTWYLFENGKWVTVNGKLQTGRVATIKIRDVFKGIDKGEYKMYLPSSTKFDEMRMVRKLPAPGELNTTVALGLETRGAVRPL
jgi:hypothetical protein